MHRLLMIVLLPSVLLLGFAIPVAAERRERISTAQSLSPTLTLFRSESEFVSAVDVDSTETFDAFGLKEIGVVEHETGGGTAIDSHDEGEIKW